MSILFYKKPDYITKEGGPITKTSCQKYVQRSACVRSQIPPELSFENVMSGKTLPPCSIPDFLDYLIYISHDAENLQFYLWMQDYVKRFNALPATQKRLSPLWIGDDAPLETIVLPGTDNKDQAAMADNTSYHHAAAENERFSKQPFRREVSQITSHYILPGAPRELNISHRDRSTLLTALSKTTHPSAFASILELTTLTLKNHSHPNFIRWSICNGNKPRVLFLRSFAIFWLTVGCLISLFLILSSKPRWIRIIAALPIWFGTVNIVAAARGLCVLLFRRSTREEHPWEIDASGNPSPSTGDNSQLVINLASRKERRSNIPSPLLKPIDSERSSPTNTSTPNTPKESGTRTSVFDMDLEALSILSGRTLKTKLEPFGPANTWTKDDPWVVRWKKMPWVRKLMLKKVWVKEEGIRILQNKIVLQAHLWGVLVTVPFIVGVVACPVVGLY